jgi:hypothetical protein
MTLVFLVMLVIASIVVSTVKAETLRPARMTGPAVKRWSGYVLVGVGAWFILLSALPDPIFTS